MSRWTVLAHRGHDYLMGLAEPDAEGNRVVFALTVFDEVTPVSILQGCRAAVLRHPTTPYQTYTWADAGLTVDVSEDEDEGWAVSSEHAPGVVILHGPPVCVVAVMSGQELDAGMWYDHLPCDVALGVQDVLPTMVRATIWGRVLPRVIQPDGSPADPIPLCTNLPSDNALFCRNGVEVPNGGEVLSLHLSSNRCLLYGVTDDEWVFLVSGRTIDLRPPDEPEAPDHLGEAVRAIPMPVLTAVDDAVEHSIPYTPEGNRFLRCRYQRDHNGTALCLHDLCEQFVCARPCRFRQRCEEETEPTGSEEVAGPTPVNAVPVPTPAARPPECRSCRHLNEERRPRRCQINGHDVRLSDHCGQWSAADVATPGTPLRYCANCTHFLASELRCMNQDHIRDAGHVGTDPTCSCVHFALRGAPASTPVVNNEGVVGQIDPTGDWHPIPTQTPQRCGLCHYWVLGQCRHRSGQFGGQFTTTRQGRNCARFQQRQQAISLSAGDLGRMACIHELAHAPGADSIQCGHAPCAWLDCVTPCLYHQTLADVGLQPSMWGSSTSSPVEAVTYSDTSTSTWGSPAPVPQVSDDASSPDLQEIIDHRVRETLVGLLRDVEENWRWAEGDNRQTLTQALDERITRLFGRPFDEAFTRQLQQLDARLSAIESIRPFLEGAGNLLSQERRDMTLQQRAATPWPNAEERRIAHEQHERRMAHLREMEAQHAHETADPFGRPIEPEDPDPFG